MPPTPATPAAATAPAAAAASQSKAIATTPKQPLSRVDTLKVLVNSEKFRMSLKEVLPRHLTAERQARILCTILGKNPKLAECDQSSLFNCMLDCSAMGLEPDGRRAHLIPYGKTCTLIVDYKGLIELMTRSGEVDFIDAYPVYTNELAYDEDIGRCRFEIEYGQEPKVFHKPILVGDRGEFVGAYAIAHIKGLSKPKFAWMTKEEIDGIRKRSKAANSGPWVTDYVEMAKKTTIRRISKTMPLSYDLAELLDKEVTHEFGPGGLDTKLMPLRPTPVRALTDSVVSNLPNVETAQASDPTATTEPAKSSATKQPPKTPTAPAQKQPPATEPAKEPEPTAEPKEEDNVPFDEPQTTEEPAGQAETTAETPAAEPEPPTPAKPAAAATDAKPKAITAATEEQIIDLENACQREDVPEEQLCAYLTKKYRLSAVKTIKAVADFAPRRVAQVLAEFDQVLAEIKATPL
jgi:recombination protein RecT